MRSIKAKQRATRGKAHCTGPKADEQTFKLIRCGVDIELDSTFWIRTLNFLTVFGERIISFFVRTVNDFESTLLSPPCFGVTDFDSVHFFEMVLNSLRSKFRVRMDLGDNFGGNKLFINVAVSSVMDAVTRMNLNRLSNLPHVGIGEGSYIEVPGALFVDAVEGITTRIPLVWDEFIDIEESTDAYTRISEQQNSRIANRLQIGGIAVPKTVALMYYVP